MKFTPCLSATLVAFAGCGALAELTYRSPQYRVGQSDLTWSQRRSGKPVESPQQYGEAPKRYEFQELKLRPVDQMGRRQEEGPVGGGYEFQQRRANLKSAGRDALLSEPTRGFGRALEDEPVGGRYEFQRRGAELKPMGREALIGGYSGGIEPASDEGPMESEYDLWRSAGGSGKSPYTPYHDEESLNRYLGGSRRHRPGY